MRTRPRRPVARSFKTRHPRVAVQRIVSNNSTTANGTSSLLLWSSPRQLNAEVVTDFQDHVIRGVRLEFDALMDIAGAGVAGDSVVVDIGVCKVKLDDTGALPANLPKAAWTANNDKQADWLFHDSRLLYLNRAAAQGGAWRTDLSPSSGYIIKTKRRMEDDEALVFLVGANTIGGTGRTTTWALRSSVWYSIG